ncbi:MAG: aminoacetone oxidase family FAD-binding enzyme [Ruminococcus sp.]|nr:aminoacetone oxidase family FAD-binding enzyme [Ruminococcus sp.]
MSLNFYDAIIIGGGASGIMCAVSAKLKNKNISVAIIEKNDRVGKKLLSTGNGRCNLTNKYISIDKYSGSFRNQSGYIFKKYDTGFILDVFKNLGLLTFCDSEGRYYPICKQASAVLDVLRFACERLGVNIFCGENIKSIRRSKNTFTVITDKNEFNSDNLVIANGSKASPKLGGNGSASDYLKNFGHSFKSFSPVLCSVKVKSDILKSLKGIRVTGKATLYDGNRKIKSESGEIQFAENALSGICIFNLSLYTKKDSIISLDLLSDYSYKELYSFINKNIKLFTNMEIENLFTGIFQKRLSQAILKISGIKDFSRKCSTLNRDEIDKLVTTVKNMKFSVIENSGFDQAQCTSGGVFGNEIDEKTMQSRLVKNLYICGEAIDICGECGGFNLHFAFASGYLAGENL